MMLMYRKIGVNVEISGLHFLIELKINEFFMFTLFSPLIALFSCAFWTKYSPMTGGCGGVRPVQGQAARQAGSQRGLPACSQTGLLQGYPQLR